MEKTAGDRFRKLLSPARLSLSASSPSLFPGSSSSSSSNSSSSNEAKTLGRPATPSASSIREDGDDEDDSGMMSRHYSETKVTQRGMSLVKSSKSLLRRSTSSSSRTSMDEEGIAVVDGGSIGAGSARDGPCSFGDQLRPITVSLSRAGALPLTRTSSVKSPRRLVSLAKIVDSPGGGSASRSVARCEEMWGMRVRYYVEHFESTTFMTVQVQDVVTSGPAEEEGIERNDQILSVNGVCVKSMTNEEVAQSLCDDDNSGLTLVILPEKQTKISNVQIFSPSIPSLDILWCVRNRLTTLTLWNIDLSEKKVPAVEVDLSRLILISNLAVCQCRLESLKRLKGLNRLQFLSHARFADNRLTAAALANDCPLADIPSIKTLMLNRNRIRDFPVCVYRLPNLEHLNLAFNQMQELPRTINALENLRQLNLDGNGLLELDTTILGFRSLKFLTISRNRIEFNPGLERQGLSAFTVFGNPFNDHPYQHSPAARRETRESLRHGSTATYRRRQKHRSSPLISSLLPPRQSLMKESVSTFY